MNPAIPAILWKVIEPVLDKVLGTDRSAQKLKEKIQLGIINNQSKTIDIARDWLRYDQATESFFYKGWRPTAMWMIILFLFLQLIVNPIMIFVKGRGIPAPDLAAIPVEAWVLILGGLGIGYPLRSTEKIKRYAIEKAKQYRVEYGSNATETRGRKKPTLSNNVEGGQSPNKRYDVAD